MASNLKSIASGTNVKTMRYYGMASVAKIIIAKYGNGSYAESAKRVLTGCADQDDCEDMLSANVTFKLGVDCGKESK